MKQLIKSVTPVLTTETYRKFCDLIYKETGITMGDSKKILVSNRLRKRLIDLGLSCYEDYYNFLIKQGRHTNEILLFMDAISTNETYFYRGENQFKALEEIILPELFSKRKKIYIWSAGCSTGEEPYTIQMIFEKSASEYGWSGYNEIHATDLSVEVIKKAKIGVYSGRTLNFLPDDFKLLFFDKIEDNIYQVKKIIKDRINFTSHNLLKQPPPRSYFDMIFCRNVMIYFNKDRQKYLIDDVFSRVLASDGYLFIGHSESLIGKSKKFQYAHIMRSPIYKKVLDKRGER